MQAQQLGQAEHRTLWYQRVIDTCRAEPLRLLYQYWYGKCGDRIAPSRADIRPEEMKRLLPNVLLIDVLGADTRLRYKLAGTEFVTIYGAEVTGQYVDEIDYDGVRDLIVADYRKVVAERRPSWTRWAFHKDDGRWLDYERLALPLSADGRSVNMLLVGVASPGVSAIPVLGA